MELREVKKQLKIEKNRYYDKKLQKRIFHIITRQPNIIFYKVMKDAKMSNYYKENHKHIWQKIMLVYYINKVHKNSRKYSIELYGKFGKNLLLCHGPIIVNGYSRLGDNVILHGMNVIGAKKTHDDAPVIGNNVDIGAGAILIGKITIADGIKIGAGAVVTKSFNEPNITIGGCPAKKIK